MGSRVLIVEDQFIEANDIDLSLKGAGHQVCGIARSYEEALTLVEAERPEIVLIDIFLNGKRTGIDLAAVLAKEGIPFIYLTANSSHSILEAAKTTRPYGFLVKPFKENDLLAAMDIACYRHNHMTAMIQKQEVLLRGILTSIINESGTLIQKLLSVVKGLKSYIPFDFVHFDIDLSNEDLNCVFCFLRIGYDEYEFNSGWQIAEKFSLGHESYNNWRKNFALSNVVKLENQEAFAEACAHNPFLQLLKDNCGANSRLITPLYYNGEINMGIRFYSIEPESFRPDHIELINSLRSLLSIVLENIRQQKGNEYPAGIPTLKLFGNHAAVMKGIVGKSPNFLRAMDQATRVAGFDTSVLVLGETGVGKEGLAYAIHLQSRRSKKPYIKVNCAAIPSALIESELFGHEKGAFTGAIERRIGKFEQAQGGTIFLDEIAEIPLEIQTKLLRVLQEKELERIGGRTTIKIDVRVIAATNRNLHEDVATGKFRMDLYYRINVFPIVLAPLRERKEDIPLLTGYFLNLHATITCSQVKQITSSVLDQLVAYGWPGNIRELQHVIERNIVLSDAVVISSIELPEETVKEGLIGVSVEKFKSFAEVNRALIIAALDKCKGRVSGKGGAAEMLNIPATTLNSKMKKLGIARRYTY
jgi:DNA-binding NtrC family response regulator